MDENLKDLLEKLKKNPIFRMSLGSKELFHSNFLEFLWDLDDSKFISVINELLLPKGKSIVMNPNSVFAREKKNFDICIHHTVNGEEDGKKFYDLIIENKVKSIPRKDQLEEYEKKAKGKGNPVFLLLSLVTDFPCRKELGNKNSPWIVAHYDQLKDAIEKHYKNVDKHNMQYINDYCNFIGIMHQIQDYMIHDFDNQVYYDEEVLKAYRNLRIHDLYIKLRGSMFITRLKEELEGRIGAKIHILPFNIQDDKSAKKKIRSFKYDDIRTWCEKNDGVHVFLDCTIQQGSGMIAAYVYKHRTDCDYIYEVAIQGNQYRHGINSHKESDITKLKSDSSAYEKEEAKKLQNLWNAVSNYDSDFFKIIHDCEPTRPEDYYNKYAPEYVYKYVVLKEGEKVADLIDAVAIDIINIIPKLNKGSRSANQFEEATTNLDKTRKRAEAIIQKYRENPSGDFAHFVRQSESSANLEEGGLKDD